MELTIKCDKKDYFWCSMYYIRRYFGLREIILLTLLLVAALLLWFLAGLILIMIFFGVTVLVVLITVALFVWTSVAGFKHDSEKQGIAYQKLSFREDALYVDFLNSVGETILSEIHEYGKIEAIAVRKNFIYIYAAIAIFYYFKRNKLEEGQFGELTLFLREHVPEEKFKFKTVKRIYPKKKKITLTPDDK